MFYSRRVASLSTALVAADLASRGGSDRRLQAQEVPVVRELPGDLKTLREQPQQHRVTVYQYESCPFCRKVRGVLDYARIPYAVVEVHPLTKAETKSFASEYGKVPILRVDDVQLRDSSRIIKAVLDKLEDKSSDFETSPARRRLRRPLTSSTAEAKWTSETETEPEAEKAWVRWTDECLVQLVVMNIYRNLREARQTFDYLLTHKDFSFFSKLAIYWSGVAVMTVVAGKRREKFHVQKGEEREQLYKAMRMFVAEGLEEGHKPFLGDERPCEADFNVYGVVRSMEGFDTQKDLFAAVPEVQAWYVRMQNAVGPSMAIDHQNAGLRGQVHLHA